MFIIDQAKLVLKRCTILHLSSIFLFCVAIAFPGTVYGQGQSVSITPALYNISVAPGQSWSSKVRIINPNSHSLTVYVEPVNFVAEGERGIGRHLSIDDGSDRDGLSAAEWFLVDPGPYQIEPNQAKEIDFSLLVPEFASPGSQSAALLISTSPPEETAGIQISTSQAVSSVFLVRVDGDVIENLNIRSFTATNRIVSTPSNTFSLRFENTGTVHMQPQGHITIYNFWNEERGRIPINQRSMFGNIMPDSTRLFEYSWDGEASILDFGRYKAEAVVSYGVDQRQTITQTIYFWVIPVKGILYTFSVLLILILIVVVSVRLYVRKILASVGLDRDVIVRRSQEKSDIHTKVDESKTKATYVSFLRNYVQYLKNSYRAFISDLKNTTSVKEIFLLFKNLVAKNYFIIVLLCSLIILVFLSTLYLKQVTVSERGYRIVLHDEQDAELSSEDVFFASLTQESTLRIKPLQSLNVSTIEQSSPITLINTSGVVGLAAELKMQLLNIGIDVSNITIDTERTEQRTVVVYPVQEQDNALLLSRLLGGVPISSTDDDSTIKVFIGNDIIEK